MNEGPRGEPGLFDLPLDAPPPPPPADAPADDPPPAAASRRGERTLPLFDAPGEVAAVADPRRESAQRGRPVAVPAPPAAPRPARWQRRLLGALGNLLVLGAAAVLAAGGGAALGAAPRLASAPSLLLFLLPFSFLYSVVPLAFWGSTPGMAWVGLVARTPGGEPLSFGQTALRWLGGWLTGLSAGLLALVALSGRSLSDRLSGSSTYESAGPS